ncbi:unnamed protein product [Discosporangium mesarthrocarpum]
MRVGGPPRLVNTGFTMMMLTLFALSAVVGSSYGATVEDFSGSRGVQPRKLDVPENGQLLFQQLARTVPIEEVVFIWCKEQGFECCKVLNNCNDNIVNTGNVCLRDHDLAVEHQEIITHKKLVTGWFHWGIQQYIEGPYSMMTIMGNPLSRYFTALQHRYRSETEKVAFAEIFLPQAIEMDFKATGGLYKKVTGNLWKLVGREWLRDIREPSDEDMEKAVAEAKQNLDTYWFVGVEEQEPGFTAMVRAHLDPGNAYGIVWDLDMKKIPGKNNFPIETEAIMEALGPELVGRVNNTLRYEWDVYEYTVDLFKRGCLEVLPPEQHEQLCTVPPSSSLHFPV